MEAYLFPDFQFWQQRTTPWTLAKGLIEQCLQARNLVQLLVYFCLTSFNVLSLSVSCARVILSNHSTSMLTCSVTTYALLSNNPYVLNFSRIIFWSPIPCLLCRRLVDETRPIYILKFAEHRLTI